MPHAFIAFGGNLPTSTRAATAAIHAMGAECGSVVAESSIHSTHAMGSQAGADFINGAVHLETQCSPEQLLSWLLALETASGRTRSVHWGPRILDLDLVLYDQLIITTPELTVPHPAMWYRGFVLNPLSEIAADCLHPVTGHSIQGLAARLHQRPLVFEISGHQDVSEEQISQLSDAVQHRADMTEIQFRISSIGSFDSQTAFARLHCVHAATGSGILRSQRPQTPPFQIDLQLADDSSDLLSDSVVQQICDVVTAIVG